MNLYEFGGKSAWMDGYDNRKPTLLMGYDFPSEWYIESWHDGREHAMADDYDRVYQLKQVESHKAIRAKFKEIRGRKTA